MPVIKTGSRLFPPEVQAFIRENIAGTFYKDLARMCNERFGTSYTWSQVKVWCKWNRLRNHAYVTKPDFGALKRQPIGTIINAKDGFPVIKVAPKRWMRLQRYIWEQHNGEIPKGMIVTFLDGDHSNMDISNLALISQAENRKLNVTGSVARKGNAEITKAKIRISGCSCIGPCRFFAFLRGRTFIFRNRVRVRRGLSWHCDRSFSRRTGHKKREAFR